MKIKVTLIFCTVCMDYQSRQKTKNIPIICKWYNSIPSCFRCEKKYHHLSTKNFRANGILSAQCSIFWMDVIIFLHIFSQKLSHNKKNSREILSCQILINILHIWNINFIFSWIANSFFEILSDVHLAATKKPCPSALRTSGFYPSVKWSFFGGIQIAEWCTLTNDKLKA